MSEWQPIETAPEDIFVLVWCPDNFCYEYALRCPADGEFAWIGECEQKGEE